MRTDPFLFTADDGAALYVHRWLPDNDGDIRAVVHIAHGLSEHGARYAEVAQFLTDSGIAVFANDHRGHGRTAADSDEMGHFAATDGWGRIAKDLVQISSEQKRQYSDRPLILLGHSLGAYLAQQMAYEQGDLFDAIAMSGLNGKVSPLVAIGKWIAKFERLRLGQRGRSRFLNSLSFDGFNKPFAPNRTPFDWLSRDAVEVDRYVQDPWCGFIATTQTWVDFLNAILEIARPENRMCVPKDLPLYLFSGHRDPVSDFGNGLETLVTAYHGHGVRTVRHRLYADARHELFNELNRAEVFDDLLDWLEQDVLPA